MKQLIPLIILFLTACSSVPLSTMMHFSNTQPSDFFSVSPEGITVKVTINSSADFDPITAVKLSASIEDEIGIRQLSFPLQLLSVQTQAAEQSFFSNRPEFNIYILKLTPQAVMNLISIKDERELGMPKKVGLSAGINFTKDINTIDENTVLSVALKFSDKDDYMTLIDNWQVSEGQ